MPNNKFKGLEGEKIASKYIEDLGYKILHNNYRTKKGEIDIIANHNETLVFVEVKLRKSLSYGHPVESISMKKVKTIKSVALDYIRSKNMSCNIRFDAVEVFYNNKNDYKVNLISNAFY